MNAATKDLYSYLLLSDNEVAFIHGQLSETESGFVQQVRALIIHVNSGTLSVV